MTLVSENKVFQAAQGHSVKIRAVAYMGCRVSLQIGRPGLIQASLGHIGTGATLLSGALWLLQAC